MTKIALQQFDGESPRTDPHYLPDSAAELAVNCKLTKGTIRPLRGSTAVAQLPQESWDIYLHKGRWFRFSSSANCVPGPVRDDVLYITTNTQPQVFNGSILINLAFSRVATKPTVAVTGALDEDTAETVKYAYTLVSGMGEETAPSNLSNGVKFSAGRTVTLTDLPTDTIINNRTITAKRIYRSQTSATGITDLYFIAEVGPAAGSFVDVWGANDIAEACPTKHFGAVPLNLRGLTGMANGMMAGFVGQEVWFCEPYQPHAWPTAYTMTVDFPIVALVSLGSSLAVLTSGSPYIMQGAHPDSMMSQKIEAVFPCASASSVVDLGGSAIYASTDGLVQIAEGGAAQLISRNLWTRDEWNGMDASSIRAGRYGDSYIFSSAVETNRQTYILNVSGDATPALTRVQQWVRVFHNDPAQNRLFYLTSGGGDVVYQFDHPDAAPMSFTWRSKKYRFNEPISMAGFMVGLAPDVNPSDHSRFDVVWHTDDSYVIDNAVFTNNGYAADLTVPAVFENGHFANITFGEQANDAMTVTFYGDGKVVYTATRSQNRIHRLPDGAFRSWQVEFSGTAEILHFSMAQSMSEVGLQ